MFASDVQPQATVNIDAIDYQVDFDPAADNCLKHPSYNENEERWR